MPKVQPASSNSGKRGRGRRVATTLAEINVVPLVDVMLVLLIIFMVTAPLMQRGLDVTLPVSRRATAIEGERVFVTIPAEYRQNRTVYLGEEPISADALQERIRQRIETLNEKEVFLQGDGSVQLQELIDIMDRLKNAGVVNVGIVTDLPSGR